MKVGVEKGGLGKVKLSARGSPPDPSLGQPQILTVAVSEEKKKLSGEDATLQKTKLTRTNLVNNASSHIGVTENFKNRELLEGEGRRGEQGLSKSKKGKGGQSRPHSWLGSADAADSGKRLGPETMGEREKEKGKLKQKVFGSRTSRGRHLSG